MCDETKSKIENLNKLNMVVWPCCSKRLFCGIHCSTVSICDPISQFNDGAE